jgi:hypothetical protein
MRARWLILIAVLLLGLILFVPYAIFPYHRFMEKSSAYYSQVADGLELVRQQHPLGTNLFLDIPVSDPSIPEVIRSLRPSEIRRFADGAGVRIGVGRGRFSVSWSRDTMRTNFNAWNLSTGAEGLRKIVYTRTGF